MAEITKNEEMATQLELVSSKLRQTEELTGGQRSEFDVTTNGQINASLDDVALQGRVSYQDHSCHSPTWRYRSQAHSYCISLTYIPPSTFDSQLFRI